MFISIITDCRDDNARVRQVARYATLFLQTNVSFLGVNSDIEAAGNLIDLLDAAGDKEGLIALNVAPRHGKAKKWPNGTPFGYFRFKNITVVCTIDGQSLSLAKKFGMLNDGVRVTDIRTVLTAANFRADEINFIANSQFRSFDYLPRLAQMVAGGEEVPHELLKAEEIPDSLPGVWWIDSFGNCKTNLLATDLSFKEGERCQLVLPEITLEATCYKQLRLVPDHETALIIGSSGYGQERFLELVVQGGSAAQKYNLNIKDGFSAVHL